MHHLYYDKFYFTIMPVGCVLHDRVELDVLKPEAEFIQFDPNMQYISNNYGSEYCFLFITKRCKKIFYTVLLADNT